MIGEEKKFSKTKPTNLTKPTKVTNPAPHHLLVPGAAYQGGGAPPP